MIYLGVLFECQSLMRSVAVVVFMSQALEDQTIDYVFQITRAVSEKENIDAFDLSPLHDHVDTEALSAIVESGDEDLIIEFSYYGYDISITGSGSVTVEE